MEVGVAEDNQQARDELGRQDWGQCSPRWVLAAGRGGSEGGLWTQETELKEAGLDRGIGWWEWSLYTWPAEILKETEKQWARNVIQMRQFQCLSLRCPSFLVWPNHHGIRSITSILSLPCWNKKILQCRHPRWLLVFVLHVPLLTQLSATVPWESSGWWPILSQSSFYVLMTFCESHDFGHVILPSLSFTRPDKCLSNLNLLKNQ